MYTLLIKENLAAAAEILKKGGLVAVPTETVYGLAANAFDAAAVQRIYEVKGRPEYKPISLLISGVEDIGRLSADAPDEARALGERFWPGPLTMVLNRNSSVPDIVTRAGTLWDFDARTTP